MQFPPNKFISLNKTALASALKKYSMQSREFRDRRLNFIHVFQNKYLTDKYYVRFYLNKVKLLYDPES